MIKITKQGRNFEEIVIRRKKYIYNRFVLIRRIDKKKVYPTKSRTLF